ncbi:MAG TPA: hypothetical protein VFX85_05865 [Solirubrobacterales bacterium]|nr:hypothetical protein [Solirubrobacterales bacterium]
MVHFSQVGGATTIDLRVGRLQRWESLSGLRTIAALLPVAFLALPTVLGVASRPETADLMLADEAVNLGIPLRFALAPSLDRPGLPHETMACQIAEFRSRWGRDAQILIEPHGSQPRLAEVHRILDANYFHAVGDNLAFARMNLSHQRAASFMSRFARALQVKGYARHRDGWRHRPLVTTPKVLEEAVTLALTGPKSLDITIETRAGSHVEDLQVLRAAVNDGLDRLAAN